MSWRSRKVGHADLTMKVEEIVGKQRPKHSSFGGWQRTYTPAKTHNAEEAIAWRFAAKYGEQWRDFLGEVRIQVTYWRCLAKSNPKKWEGQADLGKPDCDNVLKLVMDALEGTAYAKDNQVTCASVRKMPRIPFMKGNHLRIQIDYYVESYEKEPNNAKH